MPSLELQQWLTVKLDDSMPIALGAGEVLSIASLVELASPFLPEGTLDPILEIAGDLAWEQATTRR
jgi:hypothetical protein